MRCCKFSTSLPIFMMVHETICGPLAVHVRMCNGCVVDGCVVGAQGTRHGMMRRRDTFVLDQVKGAPQYGVPGFT